MKRFHQVMIIMLVSMLVLGFSALDGDAGVRINLKCSKGKLETFSQHFPAQAHSQGNIEKKFLFWELVLPKGEYQIAIESQINFGVLLGNKKGSDVPRPLNFKPAAAPYDKGGRRYFRNRFQINTFNAAQNSVYHVYVIPSEREQAESGGVRFSIKHLKCAP